MAKQRALEIQVMGGLTVSQDKEHMAELGHMGGTRVSQDRAHMARIGRIGGMKISSGFGGRKPRVRTRCSIYIPLVSLAEHERMIIEECLEFFSGVRRYTARALGISLRGLRYKLNKYAQQRKERE